ncbi:MAG: PSD1 and planctomycete cytochrome C domain-containing protein [Pirellulaceae bacterium]
MRRSLWCLLLTLACFPLIARADSPDEQFEKQIRPLLVNKCVECHAGRTPEGMLDLSSKSGLHKGGMTGPSLSGKNVDASLLFERLVTDDEDLLMPPGERLSDAEIAAVRKWIAAGAPWPDASAEMMPADFATQSDHWAFQPITRPQPPSVANEAWCRTDIDRFILARQEAAGVEPVEDADRATWLRRVTLDLTGLPPTIDEQADFAADTSDQAEQRVIDRLLASRAYAERFARRWLDVARYADTSGDGTDMPVPEARYYRDWVIDAIDADMPYDQFLIEQLAGDILAKQNPDDPENYRHTIATGYIALTRRFGNSKYAELHQIIDDTIDTVGKSTMGLSLGCARCHHHKFDPVTMEDYYGLYGYFASTVYPHAGTEHQKERSDMPAITVPAKLQSSMESHVAWAVSDKSDPGDSPLHTAGDPSKRGPKVPRGYLAFLTDDRPEIPNDSSGRLQLAQWIASKDNPLTARVMVNRIWQSHFGRGFVINPANFGVQSPPPTHPALLDYLADEFVASGWSIKHMHRLIVSSHVYRLASSESAEQLARDQSNEWLWHFPRQRMDAETFRDSILAVSGRLQSGSNGRHPFKPTDQLKYTQGNPFSEVFDHEFRSVYLMTPRLNRHPLMALFDGADANTTTAERGESTVPLQSLFVVNGGFVRDQATAFAERIQQSGDDTEARLEHAWRLAYARDCSADERIAASSYLDQYVASRLAEANDPAAAQRDAWISLARVLIASNEFMYID